MRPSSALAALAALLAATAAPARASDLSYTFIDFLVSSSSVDFTALQEPVPNQTVRIEAGGGDGIAVAGGVALPPRFYLAGRFSAAVIDVAGVVTSPLATVQVRGEFDLLTSSLGVGYVYPLGDALDLIAELNYDSTEYDFGSFAGERFDVDESGPGGRLGVRWNPQPSFELFTSVRHTPVGKPRLGRNDLDPETRLNAGCAGTYSRTWE